MKILASFRITIKKKPKLFINISGVTTKNENWITYASHYTMNVNNNPITNWWMSYLNFQIEHHLFPSMPQFRFPTLAPRVKVLFERHG